MTSVSAAASPSRWWITVAVLTAAASVVVAVTAVLHQQSISRPIGEGQLFYADATNALDQIERWLDTGSTPHEAVRRVRNDLAVEAVALTDDGGNLIAATSDSLIGKEVENPVLRFAFDSGRFGAVAAPLETALAIDGVVEWEPGEVVYMALLPDRGGGAILLYYDVAELLQRRSAAGGIAPETLELAGAALLFALAAVTTLVGRARAVQRYREMRLESEFLHKESESLLRYNAELEEARREAERALALAEEKNRIRSEFVLMINHELRTPLTSVVTGGELLASSEGLSLDDRLILDALIHDAQRLQAMIDQLLALARVENRGLTFTPRALALAEACEAASGSHSRVVHAEGSDHDPADIQVVTDIQTLTQLVASLVDNAYNHGATAVWVDCCADLDREPDMVVGEIADEVAAISVIDNGPGIRPEFLPRAFEKFEKDSRSSGTGLGLYMARLMAEAMGAALQVRTSPAGTTFSILMPLVKQPTGVRV